MHKNDNKLNLRTLRRLHKKYYNMLNQLTKVRHRIWHKTYKETESITKAYQESSTVSIQALSDNTRLALEELLSFKDTCKENIVDQASLEYMKKRCYAFTQERKRNGYYAPDSD